MTHHRRNSFDNLVNRRWFSWLDLALVMIAGIMWSAGRGLLTWQPLLIALLPWICRLIAGRYPFSRTPFDLPMLVFLLSAGVGVWAAYNRPDAWAKFWILIAAVLLFYALAGQPISNLWTVVGVIGFSGVLAGTYFLFSHNWHIFPAKFGPINNLMLGWMAIRPTANLPALPPNVAASLMAISAPLLIAWGVYGSRGNRKIIVRVSIIASIFLATVLISTTSRGAWIGLAFATGVILLFLLSSPLARRTSLSRRMTFGSLLIVTIALATIVIMLYPGGPLALVDRLPGPASGTGRFELSQAKLNLMRDFPLTGGGLGSFPGLYSQYILIIPVFFLPNGHNIFLDVGLEQGPLGAIAMVIVFLGSFVLLATASKQISGQASSEDDEIVLRLAIAAGLLIMLVHGLVEDTVYGSQAALFLYVLPGLTVAASLPRYQDAIASKVQTRWVAGSMALLLVIMVATWFLTTRQSLTSTWQANLGAVRMAQTELADWPASGWDDGSNTGKFQDSEPLFQRSLASNATNQTAHHRLGLIAMQRRNFDEAVTYLQAAWQLDDDHPGICKALAYSYVWSGNIDLAHDLLVHVPDSETEMITYSWWWADQGRDDLAGFAEQAATELHINR